MRTAQSGKRLVNTTFAPNASLKGKIAGSVEPACDSDEGPRVQIRLSPRVKVEGFRQFWAIPYSVLYPGLSPIFIPNLGGVEPIQPEPIP
jgi:hypothetical protein